MTFLDHPIILLMVAIFSFPIYRIFAKVFFGDKYEDLGETFKYLTTPNWMSLFKGNYWEDLDSTFKFYVFIALCFGWAAAITECLARYIL